MTVYRVSNARRESVWLAAESQGEALRQVRWMFHPETDITVDEMIHLTTRTRWHPTSGGSQTEIVKRDTLLPLAAEDMT